MNCSRRGFFAGAVGLALVPAIARAAVMGPGEALAPGVGELWGMAYWSRDALAPPVLVRRGKAVQPGGWHPDFA